MPDVRGVLQIVAIAFSMSHLVMLKLVVLGTEARAMASITKIVAGIFTSAMAPMTQAYARAHGGRDAPAR
jgi:hypothetical protein